MPTITDDSLERAERIYEERIRAVEQERNFGKVVSIELNSGDYEISTDSNDFLPAILRLRARHADPEVFSLRVGGGAVIRLGGSSLKFGPKA